MKTSRTNLVGPLRRRDLIAVLTYINRNGKVRKSVDGSFGNSEVHLDRLAAAARMQ